MQIKIKGFVHYAKDWHGKDQFVFFPVDEFSGYSLVGPHEITYEVPEDFNPIAGQISALRSELERLHRDYTERRAKVESKINDLLCLEAPAEAA